MKYLKIQKLLCKIYDLGKLPTEVKSIPNFKCEIDELNLSFILLYRKLWFDCKNLWFVVEYVWIQEVETMDYERIKRNANDILEDLSSECSYIEYKEAVVLKLT